MSLKCYNENCYFIIMHERSTSRIVNLKKRLKDDQFSTLGDNKYFSKDIYKHKTYIGLALLL